MTNQNEILSELLGRLSLEEQKNVITTYRDYMVIVNNVEANMFGSEFDVRLVDAVRAKRKSPLNLGVKDVLSTVVELRNHDEFERLNFFFKENLSAGTYSALMEAASA